MTMVQKVIMTIYENTCFLFEALMTNEKEKMLALYKKYLEEKYEGQLTDIISEESEQVIQLIIEQFIEDEKTIWMGLSESDMISILDKDSSFEYLTFLSDIAFEQAKECYRNRKYYNNDEEYELRLEEISTCLDKIKPENIAEAKELLSETILDIDYIFGKSEITSLRLARTI